MIYNFLFGGCIFALIEYIVNKLEDAALAAVISMIPIGFLSAFLIRNRGTMLEYTKNIFFVVCVTLFVTGLFFISLKYIGLHKKIIVIGILILWIILQFINYKYFIFNGTK
jgi:uncharacterized membrane protein YozB (DUF420 family)